MDTHKHQASNCIDANGVAPESEQSCASRALTLTAPIRVRQADDKRFAVSGTPTDCVLLGVEHLMDGVAPDLVLSGVNRGQNIAEDVTFSGTIAGAMQGMQLGIPAIALSQARGFRGEEATIPLETAETFGPGVVGQLLKHGWPKDVLMNINFPDVAAGRRQRGRGDVAGTARPPHCLCR